MTPLPPPNPEYGSYDDLFTLLGAAGRARDRKSLHDLAKIGINRLQTATQHEKVGSSIFTLTYAIEDAILSTVKSAHAEATQVIVDSGECGRWHYMLGELYLLTRQPNQALDFARRALSMHAAAQLEQTSSIEELKQAHRLFAAITDELESD